MRSTIFVLFFVFMLPMHAQRDDFDKSAFAKADHIATQYKGEALTNLPILTYKLTTTLDGDAAKFRAIYYWVTHNISGSEHLMSRNNRWRRKLKNDPEALMQWNTNFRKEIFKKLLEDKETLCTGYAYLVQKMAHQAGIECTVISGYDIANRSKIKERNIPNHSWNAVKLNGKWYLCDPTWSAGYTDVASQRFEFDYDNTYFLMEPDSFAKSHKPIDEAWALLEVHKKAQVKK